MSAMNIWPHSTARHRRGLVSALALTAVMLGVTGCATTRMERVGEGEALTTLGPPVRTNRTPLEPALAYLAREIEATHQQKLTIAVGDVKDYTGKYNINEGNAITQGGSLMVYSALGKLGGAVSIADRYDTNVTQMELSFLNQRELGDGKPHEVGEGPAKKSVPWLPYYGGSITQSDYYITGGITELNYNIQSGGVQYALNQLGPEAEVYTENVGIDLQIVNTKTLMVEKTVSLEKQITGFQVGFNIFRFFGSSLWDLNTGNKSQEPLQLGVRTALEEGVLQLVSAVTHVPYQPALEQLHDGYWIPRKTAAEFRNDDQRTPMASAGVHAQVPQAVAAAGIASSPGTLNAKTNDAPLQNGLMARSNGEIHVTFDFGESDVTGADLSAIDKAAQTARARPVQIVLLARANENWAPSKRQALTSERIGAVRKALQLRGIMQLSVVWAPGPTETGIKMDGSGYQEVASLVVKQ